jgi:hypothetical protein
MTNTDAELIESWICGNRNWVRSKLKRKAKKKSALNYAKNVLDADAYEDFLQNGVLY